MDKKQVEKLNSQHLINSEKLQLVVDEVNYVLNKNNLSAIESKFILGMMNDMITFPYNQIISDFITLPMENKPNLNRSYCG